MDSPLSTRSPSPAWRFAFVGLLASLPATVVLNWLPNSQVTVSGAIMIIGALIAGSFAVTRSVDAGAAGLRAGFLAGVASILEFLVTVDPSAAWPLSTVALGVVACVAVLCFAPVFGLVFGRIGGRVAAAVAPAVGPEPNAS